MVNYYFTSFLRLCILVAGASGYVHSPGPDDIVGILRKTPAREHTLHWRAASEPVPIQKEIQLLTSGALIRRGEFGPLHGSRELEVKLHCSELGLTFQQALSIRKQLMMHKALKGSRLLKKEHVIEKIQIDFEHKQKPLLKISNQFDVSPVSIFRALMKRRVIDVHPRLTSLNTGSTAGRIVQTIIGETSQENINDFLSEWELNELQTAKEHDIIGYQRDGIDSVAEEWEDTIYKYLDDQGINYMTEEELKRNGYALKGTPDCLLLDDLVINGQRIKWIEFKCLYASGLRENSYLTRKKIGR
ncbi:hypothetical protein ACHAWF_000434, partial [Thalassiosira exigua]